jgi:hypothetical protein
MGQDRIYSLDDPVLAEFHRQMQFGRRKTANSRKYQHDSRTVRRQQYTELPLHWMYEKALPKPELRIVPKPEEPRRYRRRRRAANMGH